MRAMIAALFLGLALLSAPRAEAQPQTCPPDCDVIPASAWPDHWSLPLGADWPVLAEQCGRSFAKVHEIPMAEAPDSLVRVTGDPCAEALVKLDELWDTIFTYSNEAEGNA